MDIVGPSDGGEASREIELLVSRQDEDGDHALAIV